MQLATVTSRPTAVKSSKKISSVSVPVQKPSRATARNSVVKAIAKPSSKFSSPVSSVQSQRSALKPLRSSDATEASTSGKPEKLGVLLLNVGSPNSLEEVQPFLYNLFNDADFVRLPKCARGLQSQLAKCLASLRTAENSKGYASLGGSSPLLRLTQDQASSLAKALEAKGHAGAKVYVGMRYWHPYTEEALNQIKADGVTKLVVIPMFPQYSIATTGSLLHALKDKLTGDAELKQLPTAVVDRFATRPAFVKSTADFIEAELKKFVHLDTTRILFTANGVPRSYVQNWGDPYRQEVEKCVGLIVDELKRRGVTTPHAVAYQNRPGPVPFLKPHTQETIRQLSSEGASGILAVPISFVTEHVGTLDELDVEYREIAEHATIQEWFRTPTLGTYGPFIEDLADAVVEAAPNAVSVADKDIKLEGVAEVSVGEMLSSSLKSWEGQTIVTITILTMLYYWIKLGRALAPAFQNLID